MRNLIIFIIITISLLGSCYYDSVENLYPELKPCDTSKFSFSEGVQPILSNKCLSCHSNSMAISSGGDIKLENYNDVKIQATNGNLYGTVAHLSGYSPMPKNSSKLDECQITIIKKWIDNGSPNN